MLKAIEKSDKTKAKQPNKRVGDSRYDFLKYCKHDYGNESNCPLCKLVVQCSKRYFEEESEQNRIARQRSLLNRAQMRISLLTNWSRCQNSFYTDFESTLKLDLVLSKALAEMILKQNENSTLLDFSEIIKILSRKNRIKEVGHFASVYLQCRIRKFLTKQYIRHVMLKRFELVPATRRKAEFYVDTYKAHKWTRMPYLLQNEAPGSPRTIDRRINAENKRKEIRTLQLQHALSQFNSNDLFAKEESTIQLLKQFVIFRDLVALAMYRLSKHSSNTLNISSNVSVSSASFYSVGSRSRDDNEAGGVSSGGDGTAFANTYAPVWICMSAPAVPARQLGLSMALNVLPPIVSRSASSMKMQSAANNSNTNTDTSAGNNSSSSNNKSPTAQKKSVVPLPSDLTKSKFTSAGGGGARKQIVSNPHPHPQSHPQPQTQPMAPAAQSNAVIGRNYNRALQVLEAKAWDCLRCSTPEEVLTKLVFADIVPSVESALNITQDEHSIWRGELDFLPPKSENSEKNRSSNAGNNGNNNSNNSNNNNSKESLQQQIAAHLAHRYPLSSQTAGSDSPVAQEATVVAVALNNNNNSGSSSSGSTTDDHRCEVLPLCMQLRPWNPERTANGLFRLFFYEEEFIAATQVSPWAFYPEVMKSRDSIASAIKNFAASLSTKLLVKQYVQHATAAYNKAQGEGGNLSRQQSPAGSRRTSVTPQGAGSNRNTLSFSGGGGSGQSSGGRRMTKTNVPSFAFSKPGTAGSAEKPGIPASSSIFAPPQDLIFEPEKPLVVSTGVLNATPVEYTVDRPLDVIGLSDAKTIELSNKYKFLSKVSMFSDRLKRAVNNTRKQSTMASAGGGVRMPTHPSNTVTATTVSNASAASIEDNNGSSNIGAQYPHLPNTSSNSHHHHHHKASDRVNEEQVKDLFNIQSDLIGTEVYNLLLGSATSAGVDETTTELATAGGVTTHTTSPGRIAHTIREEKNKRKAHKNKNKNNSSESDSSSSSSSSDDDDGGSVKSAHSHVSHLPELSKYAAKLNAYSSLVHTDINSRIVAPSAVNVKPYPYQLLVLDVYVSLPKPAPLINNRIGGRGAIISPSNSRAPLGGSRFSVMSTDSAAAAASTDDSPRLGGDNIGISNPNTARSDLQLPSSRSRDTSETQNRRGTSAHTLQQQSLNHSIAAMSATTAGNGDFAVDVHQIIGMFACHNERPPPNLECGLLNWEYFYRVHCERTQTTPHKLGTRPSHGLSNNNNNNNSHSVQSGMNSSSHSLQTTTATSGGPPTKERNWGHINQTSGVAIHKALLPTGREFQLHILGQAPSREHLDKELPKKVKIYLGMPIVNA